MEFTSSFKIDLNDKLTLPDCKWDGQTSVLTELEGEDVQRHIENMIGCMWDFSINSDLPLLRHEVCGNVSILNIANILELGSKTVVLFDPDSARFFISFSSTTVFDKTYVLAHLNLSIEDELDNYKHTTDILNDKQRADGLINTPTIKLL